MRICFAAVSAIAGMATSAALSVLAIKFFDTPDQAVVITMFLGYVTTAILAIALNTAYERYYR